MKITDIERMILENNWSKKEFFNYLLDNEIVINDFTPEDRYVPSDQIDAEEIAEALEEEPNFMEDNPITYMLDSFEDGKLNVPEQYMIKIAIYINLVLLKVGVEFLDMFQSSMLAAMEYQEQYENKRKDIDTTDINKGIAAIIFGAMEYTQNKYRDASMLFKKYVHDEKEKLKKQYKPKLIKNKKKAEMESKIREEVISDRTNQLDTIAHYAEVTYDYNLSERELEVIEIDILSKYFGLMEDRKTKEEIAKMRSISVDVVDKILEYALFKICYCEGGIEI